MPRAGFKTSLCFAIQCSRRDFGTLAAEEKGLKPLGLVLYNLMGSTSSRN